jgi:hypothetical protein
MDGAAEAVPCSKAVFHRSVFGKPCRLVAALGGLDGAQGFGRQEEEGGDEGEGPGDGDSGDAEGEQDEPDDRVEEDCGEGEGPAEDEQDAEEEEFEHGVFLRNVTS